MPAPDLDVLAAINGHEAKALRCPHCRSQWTHHDVFEGVTTGVTVRSRKAQDAHGVEVRVTPGAHVEVDYIRDDGKEFQGRRDDIEIAIACEECEKPFFLRIVQHKGWTLVALCKT